MQITFIRHGEYDADTGHLTDKGIEQMTCSAMVLQDISDQQKGILREEPFHPDPDNPDVIVPKLTYTDFLTSLGDDDCGLGQRTIHIKSEADPDLIITSSKTRAIQSGFVAQEQLKKMGMNVELQVGVPYFDELTEVSFDGGHGYISEKQLPEICEQDSIQNALKYFKKLENEGHKHIVVVTHQPNIQAFGYAICGNSIIAPPQNGDLMAIYSEAGLDDRHRLLFNRCQVNLNRRGNQPWQEDIVKIAKLRFQPRPLEEIKEQLQQFNPQIDGLRKQTLSKLEAIKEELAQIDAESLKREVRLKQAAKRREIKQADPDRKKLIGVLEALRAFEPSKKRTRAREVVTRAFKKGRSYS